MESIFIAMQKSFLRQITKAVEDTSKKLSEEFMSTTKAIEDWMKQMCM